MVTNDKLRSNQRDSAELGYEEFCSKSRDRNATVLVLKVSNTPTDVLLRRRYAVCQRNKQTDEMYFSTSIYIVCFV